MSDTVTTGYSSALDGMKTAGPGQDRNTTGG